MLAYLMDQRGLKQAGLLPIFKSSGYVSDVVNGKRGISKAHARELAGFFKVSANLFIRLGAARVNLQGTGVGRFTSRFMPITHLKLGVS
jgi:HTH-type transcriptional regulator/antitoxin HigA